MVLQNRRSRVLVPNDAARPPISECPLSHCMALLSGAWAAHVVWYLSGESRRFGELRRDIPAISARILSQRLRELEAKHVVLRAVMPTTPPSVEYSLTDLGRKLVPAVAAIAEVGEQLGRDAPRPRARRGNTVRRA